MSALDHSALHRLYSEHNGWLNSWLRARLGNTADAADLAQDTFVRVMTARNAEPIREPRGYLSAIARSLLIDKARRRTIEQAYLQALALRPEPVEVAPEVRLSIIEMLVAIDTLLDDPVSIWSIGGSILAPIFQGGRLTAQADAAAAQRDQAAGGPRPGCRPGGRAPR